MKKNHLIPLTSLLVLVLAACGGKGKNHTSGGGSTPDPTPSTEPSEPAQSSPAVTPSATSQLEKLDGLNVYVYKRYLDDDNIKLVRKAFDDHAKSQGYEVINQVWDGDASSKVADFSAAFEAFDSNANNPKMDIIVGAKANLSEYMTTRYSVLKDANDAYVEYSSTAGDKTDDTRRFWILNDSPHMDAVRLLVKSMSGYDMSKEVTPSAEPSSPAVTPTQSEPTTPVVPPTQEETPTAQPTEPVVTPTQELEQLDGLTVFVYGRYMDSDNVAAVRTAFDAHANSEGYKVINQVWESNDEAIKGSVFAERLEAFEKVEGNPKVDIVLGGKGNLGTIEDNFTALKDGDEYVIYESTAGETTNTERRFWIANNCAHMDAVKLLVKSMANYDIPEEVEPTEEPTQPVTTPTEEPTVQPTEIPTEEPTAQPSEEPTPVVTPSEQEPTVLPELVVYCYEAYVSSEESARLKGEYEDYLEAHNYVVTKLTWELGSTGKVAELCANIETYDQEHAGHEIDVILGSRTKNITEYIQNNFTYTTDDATGKMTIGESDNRLVAYRPASAHTDAIGLLLNCFLPDYVF